VRSLLPALATATALYAAVEAAAAPATDEFTADHVVPPLDQVSILREVTDDGDVEVVRLSWIDLGDGVYEAIRTGEDSTFVERYEIDDVGMRILATEHRWEGGRRFLSAVTDPGYAVRFGPPGTLSSSSEAWQDQDGNTRSCERSATFVGFEEVEALDGVVRAARTEILSQCRPTGDSDGERMSTIAVTWSAAGLGVVRSERQWSDGPGLIMATTATLQRVEPLLPPAGQRERLAVEHLIPGTTGTYVYDRTADEYGSQVQREQWIDVEPGRYQHVVEWHDLDMDRRADVVMTVHGRGVREEECAYTDDGIPQPRSTLLGRGSYAVGFVRPGASWRTGQRLEHPDGVLSSTEIRTTFLGFETIHALDGHHRAARCDAVSETHTERGEGERIIYRCTSWLVPGLGRVRYRCSMEVEGLPQRSYFAKELVAIEE